MLGQEQPVGVSVGMQPGQITQHVNQSKSAHVSMPMQVRSLVAEPQMMVLPNNIVLDPGAQPHQVCTSLVYFSYSKRM